MGGEVISRLLPVSEWPRLVGTELEAVWLHLNHETARIVVVEDEQGVIIGCWAGFPLFHAEGVWTAAAHRGKAGVARALIDGMKLIGGQAGFASIVTASMDPRVDRLLEHLGATTLPGTHYVFPIEKDAPCQPR